MKNFFKKVNGFTIIELMTVVAIIGILAIIAIPNFIGFQERAKRKAMKEIAASARPELHHWLEAATHDLKGVVDVDGNGIIDPLEVPADITTVPNSWIQSFARQKGGTPLSPWNSQKGLFTVAPVNIAHTGVIALSYVVNIGIKMRAYGLSGDVIFDDTISIE